MLETSKQIKDHKMLFKLNDTLQQNQKFIKKLKKQVSCSIVRDQQITKRNCYFTLITKCMSYVYTKVYIDITTKEETNKKYYVQKCYFTAN